MPILNSRQLFKQNGMFWREASEDNSAFRFATNIVVPDGAISYDPITETITNDQSGGSGHGVGSVTQHNDMVTAPDSGVGITLAERTKLGFVGVTGAIDLDQATLQGNVFNGASQLVQNLSDGKLPALDGTNLTGLIPTAAIGFTVLAPDGNGSSLTDLPQHPNSADNGANSNITSLSGLTTPLSCTQGGSGSSAECNDPNGAVILDNLGAYPALDGTNITNVLHSKVVENKTADYTILAAEMDVKYFTTVGVLLDIQFTLPLSNNVAGKSVLIQKSTTFQILIQASGNDVIMDTIEGGTILSDSAENWNFIWLIALGNGRWVFTANGVWLTDANQFAA